MLILEHVEVFLKVLEIQLGFFESALTLDHVSQFEKCLKH